MSSSLFFIYQTEDVDIRYCQIHIYLHIRTLDVPHVSAQEGRHVGQVAAPVVLVVEDDELAEHVLVRAGRVQDLPPVLRRHPGQPQVRPGRVQRGVMNVANAKLFTFCHIITDRY